MSRHKKELLLSVIVPVYNTEKYIRRCLDSLIKQKYTELEIILINDGSTDASAKICEEYVRRDSRIELYHKENAGAGSARKEALKYAKGDYITCVDSDDWIEENAYEELMDKANRLFPDVIACSFIKEFNDFQTLRKDYPDEGLYSKKEFFDVMKKAGDEKPFFCQIVNGSLCCKLFKKQYFEKYQKAVPSEINLSEDMAVTLPMLFEIDSIYIEKKPYYHYCQNKESSSWKWRTGEFERWNMLVVYLRQYYEIYKNDVIQRLILHSIYFSMMDLLYDVPTDYFREGIPFLSKIKRTSKVVIYGKGVYASNLLEVMKRYELCDVVCNVDSTDAEVLFSMDENEYDYVVIAILDCLIIDKVKGYLEENGISYRKILFIDKEDLTVENLPEGLRNNMG